MGHDSEKQLFYEFFALKLLENYFPERYYGITKGERPDLRMGDSRGIELIRTMFDNQGQSKVTKVIK